jgi:hypothetical protein
MLDTDLYNLGNYFKTKVRGGEIGND